MYNMNILIHIKYTVDWHTIKNYEFRYEKNKFSFDLRSMIF